MVPLERRFKGEMAVYEPTHPCAFKSGSLKGYVLRAMKVAWDGGLMDQTQQRIAHINGNLTDDRLENLRVRGRLKSLVEPQRLVVVPKPALKPKPLPPLDVHVERILFERCHIYMKQILSKEIREMVKQREELAYERGRNDALSGR